MKDVSKSSKAHCYELISNNLDYFTSEDFAYIQASLLYQVFFKKLKFPLHTAIKARSEDIVFLYFVQNDSLLKEKLSETDDKGELSVNLAL